MGFVFMGGRLMDVCYRAFDTIDSRFCMFLGWIWRKGWVSMRYTYLVFEFAVCGIFGVMRFFYFISDEFLTFSHAPVVQFL